MASRLWDSLKTLGKGQVKIIGSFAPNGSSAVASTSVKGKGFTVARTSAGLFTVTLADSYAALISGKATLQLAAGDDKAVQLGTVNLTDKTIQIRVWDTSGGAETDIAANANNRIHFEFTLSVSTLNT